MVEKIFETSFGAIHYWVNVIDEKKATLVFLPGLTADHRLFDKQIECFESKYNVFVWDAPGHGVSWPFQFEFDLMDKARWLDAMLEREKITCPIIVGQSMGGYVGQTYAQLYPEKLKGFVSIDSAPLQKKYVTGVEIWLLKKMTPVYYYYPWKALLKQGCDGVSTTEYGRSLMHEIMMVYDGDKKRYAELSGHGFNMLAEGMERDLPYEIPCPAILICGTKDRAGSTIHYNKKWHKHTKLPLYWIEGAGHNANTDRPVEVNELIEKLVQQVMASEG